MTAPSLFATIAVGLALTSAAIAGSLTEVEAQALALINAHRVAAGCKALTVQPQLVDAARGHAQAMATKDFFGHASKDGTKFGSRIRATGFKGSKLAENIAAGQRTAAEVVAMWMSSPGHRKNILTCALGQTGIAVAYQADDETLPGQSHPMRYYWVQDFAR